MKLNKSVLSITILLVLVFILVGCDFTPIPVVVPVTGVSILQDDFFQIVLGATPFQLTIEVEPVLATNKAVTWTSSNSDVVTVDGNGLLTAVAESGIAIITVTTVDGGFTDSVEIEAVAIC